MWVHRKRSRVKLSHVPVDILEFLGLEIQVYNKPFKTVEVLYAYAASRRFFRAGSYIRRDLKANDRKRLAQREMHRRFVDDWLPEEVQFGQFS